MTVTEEPRPVLMALPQVDEAPPPIHVILDDDLQLGPHESLSGVTVATCVLARTLYEMARHLLKGQVAETALIRRLRLILSPFYS